MNWKLSLDRYLTTPPEDNYYQMWYEEFVKHLSDDFYSNHESWLETDVCKHWVDILFDADMKPAIASAIIMRAFQLHINQYNYEL